MSKAKRQTLKEIKELVRGIGTARYLPCYPKEDMYIQISLHDIPFKVEKGHDEFSYDGYKKTSQRQLWYIARNDFPHPDLYIEQGFLTFQDAIKAAIKKYKKEREEQIIKANKVFESLESLETVAQ